MSDETAGAPFALEGIEDSRRAALALLGAAAHTVQLYTPRLESALYGHPELVGALRGAVLERPRLRVQLLLPPAAAWQDQAPLLVELIRRLTTTIEARTLPREHDRERPELARAFMIGDGTALLYHDAPLRCTGAFDPSAAPRARELLGTFAEVWAQAEPDPELRQLRV